MFGIMFRSNTQSTLSVIDTHFIHTHTVPDCCHGKTYAKDNASQANNQGLIADHNQPKGGGGRFATKEVVTLQRMLLEAMSTGM